MHAGSWFVSPGSSDASQTSCSPQGERRQLLFARLLGMLLLLPAAHIVGNCALKGLMGDQVWGCGCLSHVPWLRVLADPQVRVKLGADALGVASWRCELPTLRRPS